MRRLRERPSAATRSPFPNGEGYDTRIPLFSTQRLSQGGRQRGGGFAAQKGSQPRLAALGSPFQGKGLAWTLPPSYGRRCPEGAEVGWGKRHEKEENCLKCAVYESTLSTAARPPSPMGKAVIREHRYPHIVKVNTCVCGKTIPPAKPSPHGEGGDTGIPLFSTQRLSQGGRQRGGGFAADI